MELFSVQYKKHAIIFSLLVFVLATYYLRPISDPDLWWHLVIGKWILAHGDVPRVDYWNAAGIDKPWFAYSWLMEASVAFIDLHCGHYGLQFAQFLLGLCLCFSVMTITSLLARSIVIGSLLGVTVLALVYFFFALRPQVISWLLLSFMILIAERIRRKKEAGWKELISLTGLTCIWANTNITSIIGILVTCLWIVEADSLADCVRSYKLYLKVGLAAFIGTLLTPYHGAEWLMAAQTSSHPWVYSSIEEFKPLLIYDAPAGILIFGMALMCGLLHYQPKGLTPSHILLSSAFMILSLCVRKFAPMSILITSSAISVMWARFSKDPSQLGGIGIGLRKLESGFNALSIKSIVMFSSVLFLGFVNNIRIAYNNGNYDLGYTPVNEINFTQSKDLPIPIISDFGTGGYLLYRYSDNNGVPKFRVAIDGRTNVVDREIFSLEGYTTGGAKNWREFLHKANGDTIMFPNGSPIVSILLETTNEWCLVYDGNNSNVTRNSKFRITRGQSIFVKRSYFDKHKEDFPLSNCSVKPLVN